MIWTRCRRDDNCWVWFFTSLTSRLTPATCGVMVTSVRAHSSLSSGRGSDSNTSRTACSNHPLLSENDNDLELNYLLQNATSFPYARNDVKTSHRNAWKPSKFSASRVYHCKLLWGKKHRNFMRTVLLLEQPSLPAFKSSKLTIIVSHIIYFVNLT